MLVLTRRIGERIFLTGGIEITLVEIKQGKARIGIVAPAEIAVYREELLVRRLEQREREGKP